jgi:hypothetical protein
VHDRAAAPVRRIRWLRKQSLINTIIAVNRSRAGRPRPADRVSYPGHFAPSVPATRAASSGVSTTLQATTSGHACWLLQATTATPTRPWRPDGATSAKAWEAKPTGSPNPLQPPLMTANRGGDVEARRDVHIGFDLSGKVTLPQQDWQAGQTGEPPWSKAGSSN